MMNPGDRERMWRQSEQDNQPGGFAGGLAWLIAIILGVAGMVAMAKSSGRAVAVIPIGISLFFIFMFLIGHRREARRLSNLRAQARSPVEQLEAQYLPAIRPEVRLEPQSLRRADDESLRRLYDRFDVRAIEECRANNMDAKAITAFLEMARDFVDTAHSAQLIHEGELEELDRHMGAALERAKLQYELNSPGVFKAKVRHEHDIYNPPF